MIEKKLYLDIETTGLTATTSALTVIGIMNPNGDILQWFNENGRQQKEILETFMSYASSFSSIVTFHGNQFDLSFLRQKCKEFQVPYTIKDIPSLDLYQLLRPWKHLFAVKNLKQKTLESLVGYQREDSLSSKQMIRQYQDYIKTHKQTQKQAILQHNKDDLYGLQAIENLLCFPALANGNYHIQQVEYNNGIFQCSFSFEKNYNLSWSVSSDDYKLVIENQTGKLTSLQPNAPLKHYYPNPNDYYYLTDTQTLLPKSMATFLPRKQRKHPTPKQCFTKFLPTKEFLLRTEDILTFCHDTIFFLLKKPIL